MDTEGLVFRVGKALIMGIVMFFAVLVIDGRTGNALVAALVPLVLGALGVMAGLAYSLTALVFLAAIAVTLFPDLRGEQGLDGVWQQLTRAKDAAVETVRPAPPPAPMPGRSSPAPTSPSPPQR